MQIRKLWQQLTHTQTLTHIYTRTRTQNIRTLIYNQSSWWTHWKYNILGPIKTYIQFYRLWSIFTHCEYFISCNCKNFICKLRMKKNEQGSLIHFTAVILPNLYKTKSSMSYDVFTFLVSGTFLCKYRNFGKSTLTHSIELWQGIFQLRRASICRDYICVSEYSLHSQTVVYRYTSYLLWSHFNKFCVTRCQYSPLLSRCKF